MTVTNGAAYLVASGPLGDLLGVSPGDVVTALAGATPVDVAALLAP